MDALTDKKEGLEQIKKSVLELLEKIYGLGFTAELVDLTLNGIKMIVNCDSSKKGLVLGKNGKNFRIVRRLANLMVKLRHGGSLNLFLLPDVERLHSFSRGQNK